VEVGSPSVFEQDDSTPVPLDSILVSSLARIVKESCPVFTAALSKNQDIFTSEIPYVLHIPIQAQNCEHH
jgi:hypothetical protein